MQPLAIHQLCNMIIHLIAFCAYSHSKDFISPHSLSFALQLFFFELNVESHFTLCLKRLGSLTKNIMNYPSYLPTPPSLPLSNIIFQNTAITMTITDFYTRNQDETLIFPPQPRRNHLGLYPAKPDNLPPKPIKDTCEYVREKKFGHLLHSTRPLNDEERIWRDSNFLLRYTRWKSWALRMPQEWNLLDAADYDASNKLQVFPIAYAEPSPPPEYNTGVFFILFIGAISAFTFIQDVRVALAVFAVIYVVLLPTVQFTDVILPQISRSLKITLGTPGTTIGSLICWIWSVLCCSFNIIINNFMRLVRGLPTLVEPVRRVLSHDTGLGLVVADALLTAENHRRNVSRVIWTTICSLDQYFDYMLQALGICILAMNGLSEQPLEVVQYACIALVLSMLVYQVFYRWIFRRRRFSVPLSIPGTPIRSPPKTSRYNGQDLCSDPRFEAYDGTPHNTPSRGVASPPRPTVYDFGTPSRGPIKLPSVKPDGDMLKPNHFRSLMHREFT
jgi:hypothetical protein